jgi:hypothetical protein
MLLRIWGELLRYIAKSVDNKCIIIRPLVYLPMVHVAVCMKAELCGHSTVGSQKLLRILLKMQFLFHTKMHCVFFTQLS